MHCADLGLSPLIGRDEEIDLLLRRWARSTGRTANSCWGSFDPASASPHHRELRSASTADRT